MATAHQLAVITNSCFKPPVPAKTGQVYTQTEPEDVVARNSTWHGPTEGENIQNDMSKLHMSQSVNFDTTLMQTLNHVDLSNMSDTEFYERLTELKKEHKKTLEFCEKLYNEKLSTKPRAGTDAGTHSRAPVASVDSNYVLSSSQNGSIGSNAEVAQIFADHVKDMSSSKPPTGRSRASPGTPTRSASPKTRQSRSDENCRAQSGNFSDVDVSIDEFHRSLPIHNNSRSFTESRPDSRQSTRSRIDDMWDNFSVDDYAPPKIRQRSSSLSRLSSASRNEKDGKEGKSKEWRHCITVPKPFGMTLRDANRTPKKTKAMEEVERKREDHLRKEEEECQKKFKAKPVPAHVYMPLFDEIMEEKETRRRAIKAQSVEVTRSSQKPFKFDIREEEQKKFRRSHSSPDKNVKSDFNKRPKTTFKARPYPEHLFEDTAMDRLKEEEEYRKIRIQMRAEELLHSSKLPNNMAATSNRYTDGKARKKLYTEKAKKAGFTINHKFQPKVNKSVPDFEQLHHQFLKSVSQKKDEQQATVCRPFKFNTAQIVTKRHKIYEDIAKDEDSMRENQWSFRGSHSRPLSSALSTSMDSLPTKMTTAAQLRSSSTKVKMQSALERELFEAEKERRKRQKEKLLQKYIAERAADNDNTCILQNSNKQKLKEFRLAEKARQDEYKRQLDEMNNRLKSRPLLFERTMQDNAKKRAEKKYQETLRKAGLDDGFISTKGADADLDDLDDLDLDSEGYEEMSGHQTYDASSPGHSSRHSQSHSLSGSHRQYTQDFDEDDGPGSHGSDRGNQTGDDEDEIEEEYGGADEQS